MANVGAAACFLATTNWAPAPLPLDKVDLTNVSEKYLRCLAVQGSALAREIVSSTLQETKKNTHCSGAKEKL